MLSIPRPNFALPLERHAKRVLVANTPGGKKFTIVQHFPPTSALKFTMVNANRSLDRGKRYRHADISLTLYTYMGLSSRQTENQRSTRYVYGIA